MNNYTDLEKTVFNALIDICMDDVEASASQVATVTGLTVATIKGVVGSLVKKGMVCVGEEVRGCKKFTTINPIVDGESMSFGCDQYDEEEIEHYKI